MICRVSVINFLKMQFKRKCKYLGQSHQQPYLNGPRAASLVCLLELNGTHNS